ncbi:hypothetical protein [Thalassorhabdomicrobium marinisediminis]|uniref:Uncharacterized protein n=1 Tax=Thalassorhabdomicrobium marinisediminis TaxID=2170577 RepID=A0A2T7G1R0_9RHOB|nr:hypothetical protein [Thalassorhabdomicrobium marinisediminis]PVA08347.1 hypothetical protein DC363_02345 [Thalassorhabdomicrobium marinisediminis]
MTAFPAPPPGSAVLDLLLAEFPFLDPVPLKQAGQDWPSIIPQLARAHDLTPREAAETLQDWLIRRRHHDGALAA